MSGNKKKNVTLFFLKITLICLFIGLSKSAFAYPNLAESPLPLENLFRVPSGANSYVKNYLDSPKEQVAVVTESKRGQVGSIFSTESNKLDFTKDFSAKMSLYLGDRRAAGGDGIAFVIHNDPAAIETFNGTTGMQLGIYNSNYFGGTDSTKTLKNSLAIEFDTYYNGDFFDQYANSNNEYGHVAYAYPNKASSYNVGTNNKVYLVHRGIYYPRTFLSNGQWHTLSISWKADTQAFSYQFDSAPIVKFTLDVNGTFNTNSTYWGFTGSTGSAIQENVIAFNRIPGAVELGDNITLLDSNNNNVENKVVKGKEKLTSYVAVSYKNGNQNLLNPKIKLFFDKNVTFNSETTKLNYNNVSVIANDDGSYTVPISELSMNNSKAMVTFDVIANNSTSTTALPSSISYQVLGDNYIGDVTSVNFQISKEENTKPTGIVKTNLTVPVNGTLQIKDMFSEVKDSGDIGKLTYSYVGPALDTTTSGNQTVTVRITNSSGNYTDYSVPVQVTAGNFGLLSVDTLNFGTIKSGITTKNIELAPNQTVGISMEDQRGTKVGWHIQAKASSFTSKNATSGKSFTAGIKIPKGIAKINGTTSTDLTTLDVTLNDAMQNIISAPVGKGMNGWTYSLGTTTSPVSLMNIPSTVYIGDYRAILTWSMINAPN